MSYGEAAGPLGDGDLGASDDGSCEGSSKEVDILVDGIALHGWVTELFNEFPAEIHNLA